MKISKTLNEQIGEKGVQTFLHYSNVVAKWNLREMEKASLSSSSSMVIRTKCENQRKLSLANKRSYLYGLESWKSQQQQK